MSFYYLRSGNIERLMYLVNTIPWRRILSGQQHLEGFFISIASTNLKPYNYEGDFLIELKYAYDTSDLHLHFLNVIIPLY